MEGPSIRNRPLVLDGVRLLGQGGWPELAGWRRVEEIAGHHIEDLNCGTNSTRAPGLDWCRPLRHMLYGRPMIGSILGGVGAAFEFPTY